MDETDFVFEPMQIAEASRLFPAHRREIQAGRPVADVSYLTAPNAEFGRHAWDEGGHF